MSVSGNAYDWQVERGMMSCLPVGTLRGIDDVISVCGNT
jgi:hypothetical protein